MLLHCESIGIRRQVKCFGVRGGILLMIKMKDSWGVFRKNWERRKVGVDL